MLVAGTALGLSLCWQMAAPFLSALSWAFVLAVLFAPVQSRMEGRLRRPGAAASVTVILVAVMVVLPAGFVGQRLIGESARGAQTVQAKIEAGEWRRFIEGQSKLAPAFRWIERRVNLPETVRALSSWLAEVAGSLLKGSLVQAVALGMTFYLLFYFLRDRREALVLLRLLSPLSVPEMNQMLGRVRDTVVSIAYGTLAVAAVQGLLGGLMFWWLGLPVPLLWGMVMSVLAVVPMLGAFVVWAPAALFLAMDGDWTKALILTAWGTVVVGLSDNILRPILVGKRMRLHSTLVFMSVVGGVIRFGSAGLVLGPVILTVTAVLLEVWRARRGAGGDGCSSSG